MKTLDEVVKDNMDKMLYIGSASGFFFIGPYEEYIHAISAIQYDLTRKAKKNMKNAESNYRRALIMEQHHYITRDCVLIKESLAGNSRRNYEYVVNNPMKNRPVIKTFSGDIKEQIIIVEGYEVGDYWLRSEYEESRYYEYFKHRTD